VMVGIEGGRLAPPFGLTWWNMMRDGPTGGGELMLLFFSPSSIILPIPVQSVTNLSFVVSESINCWIRLRDAWRA